MMNILFGVPETASCYLGKCLACRGHVHDGDDVFRVGFQLTDVETFMHSGCYSDSSRADLRTMLIHFQYSRDEAVPSAWFNNGAIV